MTPVPHPGVTVLGLLTLFLAIKIKECSAKNFSAIETYEDLDYSYIQNSGQDQTAKVYSPIGSF